ncbi:hypothetical protein IWQ60_010743 [Tieghemiomyces parasiticus]|uniref:RlpA-like protein double-psi beta-barrel domain-containing protein n=1 Tax=Tieghemiomyces parasiticus TaxID=78921 RepID=A0A9W8DI26_9FUNG|nr:hypothetical protein IWQ60_010743 [Tieghemiomyces parasiticus]
MKVTYFVLITSVALMGVTTAAPITSVPQAQALARRSGGGATKCVPKSMPTSTESPTPSDATTGDLSAAPSAGLSDEERSAPVPRGGSSEEEKVDPKKKADKKDSKEEESDDSSDATEEENEEKDSSDATEEEDKEEDSSDTTEEEDKEEDSSDAAKEKKKEKDESDETQDEESTGSEDDPSDDGSANDGDKTPKGGQTGKGSFYDQTGTTGFCGTKLEGDVVALSEKLMGKGGKSPLCGKKVSVTSGSTTRTFTIADSCVGCPENQLDFLKGGALKLNSDFEEKGIIPITFKIEK